MERDRTDADGLPATTEDQRGESQPADGGAVEEAAAEAEAVEHPPPDESP